MITCARRVTVQVCFPEVEHPMQPSMYVGVGEGGAIRLAIQLPMVRRFGLRDEITPNPSNQILDAPKAKMSCEQEENQQIRKVALNACCEQSRCKVDVVRRESMRISRELAQTDLYRVAGNRDEPQVSVQSTYPVERQ